MAQPSVRRGAMAEKNQAKVWDEVRESHRAMAAAAPAAPPTSATSSYANVVGSAAVRQEVDRVAAPLERSYEKLLGSLRERKAVGVVVAVNGRIIWADVFPSTALFEKYWPKLVRSYAAEAVVARTGTTVAAPPREAAERFLSATEGREVAETEPGLYRVSETVGEGYKVFTLTSLLPGADYVVHLAKMVTGPTVRPEPRTTTQELREPAMVRPRVQW